MAVTKEIKLQHPNIYNSKLPKPDLLEEDRVRYLEEIRTKLSSAVLENDTGQIVIWIINLHKYIILYGLAFSREEHVFYIKLLYGLLTTKNVDPVSLDKYAKVLYALIKKKYLVPRTHLILDWRPLWELFRFWDDSSFSMRGLLKCASEFKTQLRQVIKVCRGYFSDESTQEMLTLWKPMLCPADRSMATATKYFMLFLPTTKDIPAEKSWMLWRDMLQSFWRTWGNSPGWEVDILKLYTRLATHRIGAVDWEPMMTDLYTRFMSGFNLPVTFGGSGLQIKHGISGANCNTIISKWIVSTLGPGSSSQSHLTSMLRAIRSYYHPANLNNSSEQLHVFISSLCTHFIDRLHLERHNKKWETKVPLDKRLREEDISQFVEAVTPIAWMVLYNNYEEEARNVFSSLALVSPASVIPKLLETLSTSKDILTEPHRFHVCIQAVSAVSGPLVRNFPGRSVQLLHSLLPAIDVNDIWRSTDIFVCMSDLLERMAVSATIQTVQVSPDDVEISANFEDFVVEFISKCFNLVENSKRENFRVDGGSSEEFLNDEEIAADAAINDTFLRMCINASPEILHRAMTKLTEYITGRIVEPTVAGGILSGMCKSVVQCDPAKGLKAFIPMLVRTILERMRERTVDSIKLDEELQFNLQLLGEVLCCTNAGVFRSKGEHLLPWIEDICSCLDKTLNTTQKDEYEFSHTVLQALLTWLCRTRLIETGPRMKQNLNIATAGLLELDNIAVEWYIPGEKEIAAVNFLLQRYLAPILNDLSQFSSGELSLDNETLQRTLKLVLKIVNAISEMIEPVKSGEYRSVLSSHMSWLDTLYIKIGGESVRKIMNDLMGRLQEKLIRNRSDDTDSFLCIIYIYDVLLFSHGLDEDEIGDHIDDHKREKVHREDKLRRGKKHLPGVHLDRIALHWETHVWLKNLLVMETVPDELVNKLLLLCTYRYSEVRVAAQELLIKVLARVGSCSHKQVLPYLVECLGQVVNEIKAGDTSMEQEEAREEAESRLKGALYIIYSEKHMFFYSWEAVSKLWPALVTAQQSDKQSVDDLLKDISIKANRYYQDFTLYTMPLSGPVPPPWLMELVRNNSSKAGQAGAALASNNSMKQVVHYQELEGRLVQLLSSNTLHWRHQEMGVGMLLTMITYDHTPNLDTTQLWLSLLVSDTRNLRMMAYQALEGILKLCKVPSVKVALDQLVPDMDKVSVTKPGVREDNTMLQYRGDMAEADIQSYWARPFVVKSYVGYYSWPGPGLSKARMIQTKEHFSLEPNSVRGLVAQFFMEEPRMKTFVEFNSLEHEKGQDFFSTDRGLFLSFLLENVGPAMTGAFQPHIERLVSSPEESQQRAAAEMVYGLVRGSRFWDWESSQQLWAWLLPVFQQVLNNVTSETQSDWDFCFSGASNKADPNRLRWLFELLITPENLVSQGSFKESSYLLFVSKCLSMNWRVQELYCRTYNILREHWDHPYNNVRHQIAATLATLTNMDIGWAGAEAGNVGQGFPTKKLFIDEVTPMLTLNCPNPEFQGSRSLSPASLNTSHSSTEDVSMETVEDEETKRAKRILEMVSLWVCHTIRLSSASVDPILYQLLPYMCQFIGTESDQGVSQSCLQALSYLSVCILPAHALAPCLHMLQRCVTSTSYKTKLSILEFLQTVVFTNFTSFVSNNELRSKVICFTTDLLTDSHITVRQKAAKILGGLLHSGFVGDEAVKELLAGLRSKVRVKLTRRQPGRRFRKEAEQTADQGQSGNNNTGDKLVTLHSGILGLCAFVEAFPHDVPTFIPPILMELSTHLNDPQPVPMTIKKSLQEFKRTHQDNWQEHKTKFTEDQLYTMTDILVSHNYYA